MVTRATFVDAPPRSRRRPSTTARPPCPGGVGGAAVSGGGAMGPRIGRRRTGPPSGSLQALLDAIAGVDPPADPPAAPAAAPPAPATRPVPSDGQGDDAHPEHLDRPAAERSAPAGDRDRRGPDRPSGATPTLAARRSPRPGRPHPERAEAVAAADAALLAATGPGDLARALCRAVVALGPFDLTWVGHPRGRSVEAVVAATPAGPVAPAAVPATAVGFGAVALRTGEPTVVDLSGSDPRLGWSAAVPLADGTRARGVLVVHTSDPAGIEPELVRLVDTIGGNAMAVLRALVALERSRPARAPRPPVPAEALGSPVVVTDPAGVIETWNAAAAELLGWSAEEVVGRPLGEVLPPLADPERDRRRPAPAAPGRGWSEELQLAHRWGRPIPVLATEAPLVSGTPPRSVGRRCSPTSRAASAADADLARRLRLEEELVRVGRLALTAPEVHTLRDDVTSSCVDTLDVDVVSLETGRPRPGSLAALVHGDGETVAVADLASDRRLADPESDGLDGCTSALAVPIRIGLRPGGALVVASRRRRRFGPEEVGFLERLGETLGAALQREHATEHLRGLALYDPLTRLPNRTLLHDRIAHALRASARLRRSVGVLLVRVDGPDLGDGLPGDPVHDELMITVGARLAATVRGGDTVARPDPDADIFAVVCDGVGGELDVIAVANRIAGALSTPFRVGTGESTVTVSVGFTMASEAGTSPVTILEQARVAMVRALEEDSAVEAFDEEQRRRARERSQLDRDLARALGGQELRLLWQPEVPIGERAAGQRDAADIWAEGFLRWNRSDGDAIGPLQVMELAERAGAVAEITEWALRAACRQLRDWEDGYEVHPGAVCVNLSGRQLAQPGLPEMVRSVTAETRVGPGRLVLDVSETTVAGDPRAASTRLADLREAGARIAIDDFGTASTSMSLLRDLPVDALKVDRALVARIDQGGDDRAIVGGIIELGHALGLEIIAEGVESRRHLAVLEELGCDRAQGFLWTRPLPGRELANWMGARRGGMARSRFTEPDARGGRLLD